MTKHGEEVMAPLICTRVCFIEKLEAFSETSVEKYIDMQENVRAAKERIWRRKDWIQVALTSEVNIGQYFSLCIELAK